MISVHGDVGGDWGGRKGVEAMDDEGSEGGFTRAGDARDSDEETAVW